MLNRAKKNLTPHRSFLDPRASVTIYQVHRRVSILNSSSHWTTQPEEVHQRPLARGGAFSLSIERHLVIQKHASFLGVLLVLIYFLKVFFF